MMPSGNTFFVTSPSPSSIAFVVVVDAAMAVVVDAVVVSVVVLLLALTVEERVNVYEFVV